MLSNIDLIIISEFLKANAPQFSEFCITECIGTKGTGPATIKHIEKELAKRQVNILSDKGGHFGKT